MRITLLLLSTILLTSAFGTVARSEFRTWTDRTGDKTVKAELLQGDEQRVRLRLQNGKVVTSRLELFSELDQVFVRKTLASSNSLENTNTKTKPSEDTRAKERATIHVLSGRLASGAVLKGRAKQPGFGTWACRLEISKVQNNSFKGVLHLDSAMVGHADAFVNASLEIEGQLQGSETVHFTVTRIRQQSRHPKVFLGDDNIGQAYLGLVRGNRIVGQTYARLGSSAASLTMEFACPPEPAKVVALGTETSPATPGKRQKPDSTDIKPSADELRREFWPAIDQDNPLLQRLIDNAQQIASGDRGKPSRPAAVPDVPRMSNPDTGDYSNSSVFDGEEYGSSTWIMRDRTR